MFDFTRLCPYFLIASELSSKNLHEPGHKEGSGDAYSSRDDILLSFYDSVHVLHFIGLTYDGNYDGYGIVAAVLIGDYIGQVQNQKQAKAHGSQICDIDVKVGIHANAVKHEHRQ